MSRPFDPTASDFTDRHDIDFVVGERADGGSDVWVTGPWHEDSAAPLLSGEADGLVLNYAHGFVERDLEFIRSLPLANLVVISRSLDDLSPIEDLGETLLHLDLVTPLRPVDVRKLPNLRSLKSHWRQVDNTLSAASQLREVGFLRYSAPDLSPFETLRFVRTAKFYDVPRFSSLRGFGSWDQLDHFEVRASSTLSDISDLRHAQRLSRLIFRGCRRIANFSPLSACSELRSLELGDCADVPDLRFLAGLENLNRLHIHGDTKIVDGDLRPIRKLPSLQSLTMRSRRSYTPSVDKIEAELARGEDSTTGS